MMVRVHDDTPLSDLVARALDGDSAAWDQLVERFATLVWSVCGQHGLSGPDADDVGGSVWLRLVENLATLREPAALPGWLATTTRRECLAVLRHRKRQIPVDDPEPGESPHSRVNGADDVVLVQERRAALRSAFARLPERCRRLLAMLFEDPPTPYALISSTLGMPVGAIGPNRQRCLARMRASNDLVALGPA